jgi:hypothetical protein
MTYMRLLTLPLTTWPKKRSSSPMDSTDRALKVPRLRHLLEQEVAGQNGQGICKTGETRAAFGDVCMQPRSPNRLQVQHADHRECSVSGQSRSSLKLATASGPCAYQDDEANSPAKSRYQDYQCKRAQTNCDFHHPPPVGLRV